MKDPLLLTPGPLTTSATVKTAMLRDWGSRDDRFIQLTARIRERVTQIAGGQGTHVCVPIQGSGTFAIEATLGTLVPRQARLLVLVNGAYGQRMVRIANIIGRDVVLIEFAEDQPVSASSLHRMLSDDREIGYVAVVHCETTTGILNPIDEIAVVCRDHGKPLIVDAMSSFGALPIDLHATPCAALVASSNKCLEGVPGVGFAVIRRDLLEGAAGNAPSLSLDLHDQWRGFEQNGQWRFTPPTHVLAALDRALEEHAAEGGVAGRGKRYRRNLEILLEGMTKLGFRSLLPAELQAPIIVTFLMPADPAFHFKRFYEALGRRGYVIYPGKLTRADSFRIGCIGHLGAEEMMRALAAIGETLAEMGVRSGVPHLAEAAPGQ